MTIAISFHGITTMTSIRVGASSWLEIHNDANEANSLSLHMPYEAAQMLEAAWQAWLDVGKPATEAPTTTTQGIITCAEW